MSGLFKRYGLWVAIAIVFAACGFVFFKGFYESAHSSYTQEILAATLGTVMLAVITALLLNAQSAAEERREKTVSIFQRKLELYTEFLDFVYDMIEDHQISRDEIKALTKWMTRISLIADYQAVLTVYEFVRQCCDYQKFRYEDLSEEERAHWSARRLERDNEEPTSEDFITVGLVVGFLREDLGESRVSDEQKASVGQRIIDDMTCRLEANRLEANA